MRWLQRARSRAGQRLGLAGALAFAAQSVAGCYARQVADPATVAPGAVVVVTFSDRGRVDLNDALGRSPLTAQGRLTARTDSTLTVAITQVVGIGGERADWPGDAITLRTSGVAGVQVRRLNRGRTGLAVAGAVAAAAALIAGVSLVIKNSNGGGDGPPGSGGGGNGT